MQFVAAHPIHSAVGVYYEPEHPESAVLIRGPVEMASRLFDIGWLCCNGWRDMVDMDNAGQGG